MAGRRPWTSSAPTERLAGRGFVSIGPPPENLPGEYERVPDRAEGAAKPRSLLPFVASIGPGILVMLADTDAGNVVTAAQSGARWGYRLLPLLLGLIPVLYMVQELAVRLGIFTGRGYNELIRCHFGHAWAWVSA